MSSKLSMDMEKTSQAHPAILGSSTRDRIVKVLSFLFLIGFTFYCLVELGFFDFKMIWRGVAKLYNTIQFMLPPASRGRLLDFIWAIFETLGMAFIGTLIASIFSLFFGLLCAQNVIPNRVFHFCIRRFIDFIRGIDALIWALVWINVVGLGPFAGILAIAVSNTGEISKLFSEAIENVDNASIQGVRSSGANLLQTIRFAILPQVTPVLLSNALYYFESNTRSATILGIVGAGGVGLILADRIRVMAWDQVSMLIIMILATVYLIDNLSAFLRKYLIGSTGRGFKVG